MVQESIALLAGHELELAQGFYGHLFDLLPEVRALFPDGVAEQRIRLLKALLALMESLDAPELVESRLQVLGEIHYHRGIADDQYQYVGYALIRTVRDIFPEDWSTWLSSAWIGVSSWMIQHVVAGAKRASTMAKNDPSNSGLEDAQRRYAELQARTWSIQLPPPEPDGLTKVAEPFGHRHVPVEEPARAEYSLAASVPGVDTEVPWFRAPGDTEPVPTIFPRRRPGAGHL
jgi:hemoglobin-like flavoprotein